MKRVFKAMFGLLFTWLFLALLAIVIYIDFKFSGATEMLPTFLCFILFWFYYEITSKDLQLVEANQKKYLSFSKSGIKSKLKSQKKNN